MHTLAALAAGHGGGWPPEHDVRVLARRPDAHARAAEFAAHRALRRRGPDGGLRGARNSAIAEALDVSRAATSTCGRCGALVDVFFARRGERDASGVLRAEAGCAGVCGRRFRPGEHAASQRAMAAALEAGERVLVSRASIGADVLHVYGRAATLAVAAAAVARLDAIDARRRARRRVLA